MNHQRIKIPTFNQILKSVCGFYNISTNAVIGPSRKKNIVKARQVIVYLARENLRKSFPFIGKHLGRRDHTTALYAYSKIKKALSDNNKLRQEIKSILDLIGNIQNLEVKARRDEALPYRPIKKKQEKHLLIIKSLDDFPKSELSYEQIHRQNDILDKYKDGWTLEEIGKEYNLTRERIRQIVERGLIYSAKEIVRQGVVLDLKEFLKGEKHKHLIAMRKRKGLGGRSRSPSIIKKEKRWSRYYDRCRRCGSTIIPHQSHGYCRRCYSKTQIFKDIQRSSRLRNIEKRRKYVNAYSKIYSKRPEVIERRKKQWDLKYFGGNREKAIIQADEKCQICGLSRVEHQRRYNRDLFVVHVHNARDNSLENLLVLCKKCFYELLRNKKLGKKQ